MTRARGRIYEMPRRIRLIIWGTAALVVLIVALTVGQGGYLGELINRVGETGSPVPVHDLNSIGTLREAFNADVGTPRLIMLVSPT